MHARSLVDTGALLALLDRGDRWHAACAIAFASLRLPLVTTNAVLTELFHLVGDDRREVRAAWRLLRSGALAMAAIGEEDWPELEALMDRYHDRPMDFADATLVRVASRDRLSTIFTVDHDDFETYRIDGQRRFRIMPARQAVTG